MTLEMLWEKFIRILNNAGRKVFGLTSATPHTVPSWNGYLKELFDLSATRQYFLAWHLAGSPRNGIVANDIRRRRAVSKAALKKSRKHEKCMRAEGLQSRNFVSFWKGKKHNLSKCIDRVYVDENILKVMENQCSRILKCLEDSCERDFLQDLIPELPQTAAVVQMVLSLNFSGMHQLLYRNEWLSL